MDRWTVVFKMLANVNRLKIIALLKRRGEMAVGEIADALEISGTATSRHLNMLQRMGVLKGVGKYGHVFYSVSGNIPSDFQRAILLFTKR